MNATIEIKEDPASAAATVLLEAVQRGGHVVLAGGSTPRAAYEQLAEAVTAAELELDGTTLWFGDERCVEPDDERSNYLMVKQSLLDPIKGVASPEVCRIKGELGPDPAAEDYERELHAAGSPRFDLVLLGLGSDGHTASLFPDQPSLEERERLVLGVAQAGLEPFVPRVTLTLPALASARHIVFLAKGESKADAVAASFAPDAQPNKHIPSSLLVPLAQRITVLIDEAAAERL